MTTQEYINNISYANKAQEIFGISTWQCYVFVGIFLFFVAILIVAQLFISKLRKKTSLSSTKINDPNQLLGKKAQTLLKLKKINWMAYLPFVSLILSLIIVLPFEAKVGYVPWGNSYNGITNNYLHGDLWYAQILQFTIVIGNIYMIFLVIFLISALFFNIMKTMYKVTVNKEWRNFIKYTLVFVFISISMLLLINLYRVFPIYNYDMNNNPNVAFTLCGSPIGIHGFNGEGYWPFFITNFLIAYFFTGNYDVSFNGNANYDLTHPQANPALPVQVPIVLGLFSLAFIIGIILGLAKPNYQSYLNFSEKAKKFNNKALNIVYACLSVASLSFFSESLLQSQIGTWMHLTFVFILMIIAWVIFYLMSGAIVMTTYRMSFKTYFKEFMVYMHQAFKRNSLDNKEFKLLEEFINKKVHVFHQTLLDKDITDDYKQITYISETVIFPLALIGYLSFLPSNGWMFTSNVNTAGYWFAMFFGSFFCFVGTYGISGMASVAQNMQASTAFNVMCGTNTGIFGPYGFIMNKFRVQIDLNFLFSLIAIEDKKTLKQTSTSSNKTITPTKV